MYSRIFKLSFCLLFVLSMIWITGCEKVENVVTDSIVIPIDTESMSTLKVGLIRPHPLYFSFGEGAELAQTEINQAGGVLGMPVEFVYREELSVDVVQSATELIEDENVVAILGPLFSSHAVKVGPIATVPVLLGATGANVTETGDFLFLVASSNALQAKLMAQFAFKELNATTAAMIWQNQDVYSIGFVNAFEENFMELGGSIVAKEIYESGDVEFNVQLTNIKDKAPDVLFLASFPPENPLIIKQARGMEIQATFIGSDGWDDPLMFENMDAIPHLENSYYCTNFDPDATDFITSYEVMFEGNTANGIAASGYDAMRILATAIENAQSTDPMEIRSAISEIANYTGATSISNYDVNRHPVKSVGVFQIKDGQPQPYKVVGSDTVYEIEGPE